MHYITLSIAFGVIHSDEHVQYVTWRIIDLLLSEIERERLQVIWQAFELSLAFILAHDLNVVLRIIFCVVESKIDTFLRFNLVGSLHLSLCLAVGIKFLGHRLLIRIINILKEVVPPNHLSS